MPSAVVDQLVNGVRVVTADGKEIICKALPWKTAKEMIKLSHQQSKPFVRMLEIQEKLKNGIDAAARDALELELVTLSVERAKTRQEIVTRFFELYPELESDLSAGDAEELLPVFFWSVTGASVPSPAPSSKPTETGTGNGASTSPSGAPSPTP